LAGSRNCTRSSSAPRSTPAGSGRTRLVAAGPGALFGLRVRRSGRRERTCWPRGRAAEAQPWYQPGILGPPCISKTFPVSKTFTRPDKKILPNRKSLRDNTAGRDFCGGALPHIEIAGSLSACYRRRPGKRPGKRRATVVRGGAAGCCVLAYVLAGCSGSVNYGMTRCPAASLVGGAAMANDVKLLPGSAAIAPGSTTPGDWTCNYIPADQYQRWLHGFHDALSVEIYLFPKKLVNERLLGSLDGHAALRSGAATVSGHIMLAGEEAPVASFRTGYGAWTGQRLPDGSYSALAIYLSAGQAPRTAAEFRNELQAMAQVSGLG
jgi:hypothetical protein